MRDTEQDVDKDCQHRRRTPALGPDASNLKRHVEVWTVSDLAIWGLKVGGHFYAAPSFIASLGWALDQSCQEGGTVNTSYILSDLSTIPSPRPSDRPGTPKLHLQASLLGGIGRR